MSPKVSVIILDYNRPDDTLECLESVKQLDYAPLEIIVVDNASKISLSSMLKPSALHVTCIRTDKNLGYAGGNNVGLRYAFEKLESDYALVLNNDTVIEKNCLSQLVSFAESHPEATLVAPKVCFYDNRNIINSCGTTMNWLRLRPEIGLCGQPASLALEPVLYRAILPGSALLMSRKLIEKTGLFDENFFLIHEDAELSLKNIELGFKNAVVTDAVIYHKVSKTLSSYPFLTQYYTTRNFMALVRLRGTFGQNLLAHAGIFLLAFKNLLLWPSAKLEQKQKIDGFFKGMRDYFINKMGPYETS